MSNQQAQPPELSDVWAGDLFERQKFADFLTTYLTAKCCPRGQANQAYTVALDAGWGRGKTFFVDRWATELSARTPRHPVLKFNAWASDFASDPLVAFMAAFRKALEDEVKALGPSNAAAHAISNRVDKVVAGMRRAYLPAAKVVLKGVVQKVTGTAVDEVMEAIKLGDTQIDAQRLEKLQDDSLAAVGKGLDEFFRKTLEEQTGLSAVIRELRVSIETTLQALVDAGQVALPMFVFVDELDRCRPSFAIALLEGIKHIFGVRGVCFVVSTHLTQLAAATTAVYGAGFDGTGYLKRFFDVTCELPAPSTAAFADALFAGSPALMALQLTSGMPAHGLKDTSWGKTPAAAFCWVMDDFRVGLRSQQQIFTALEAAALALPRQQIHVLWLALLCTLHHLRADIFEQVARRSGSLSALVWQRMGIESKSHTRISRTQEGGRSYPADAQTSLMHVAGAYYAHAFDIPNRDRSANMYDYPANVTDQIGTDETGRSQLLPYFEAVRSAGFISQ